MRRRVAAALLLAWALCCGATSTQLQPDAAALAAGGPQADGWTFTVDPGGSVGLHGITLRDGSVAAVRFLPNSLDVAEAIFPRRTLLLDWQQTHEGGTYSVVATLPPEVSWTAVSQVVAYCESCGSFTGVLASAAVPPAGGEAGGGNGGSGSGGTVVFIFQNAQLVPADPGQPQQVQQAVPQLKAAQASSGASAAGISSATGASGRRLQQSQGPPADCSLQVGDQTLRFGRCQAVPMTPNILYQCFCTLEPGGSQGGTRWRGGLKIAAAAVGGQWAGFGFPQYPGTMVGADAIVVKECSNCSSGASVNGYKLRDYVPQANIPGSYPITDASAAKAPDGSLVAHFTADLPKTPDQILGSKFNIIYAIGPLAPDGSLLPHPATGRPFGGTTLQLRQAGGAGAPQAAPAAEGASPAAPLPAAAPASAPERDRGVTNSGCQLSLSGRQLDFSACTHLDGIGSDTTLMWSLRPLGNGSSELTLGLRAAGGGWAAVGFPASPGRMLGATAMVLHTCPTCPSGAKIEDRFLAARDPSGVQPPGHLPGVSGAEASAGSDGSMQGTIKVLLDSSAAGDPAFPIICAAGPVDSAGEPQYHGSSRGAAAVNLATGSSSGVEGLSSRVQAMRNAHGWLMAVAWGVLIPAGIVIARHGRWLLSGSARWFHLHRAIQVLGLACALSGFIIIFYAVKEATGTSVSAFTTHRRMGISAMTLGLFQLTALVFRPHPGTRFRLHWELVHHWVGRAAAVVATANIYWGIIRVRGLGAWAVATYSVVWGLIVAAGLAGDAWLMWRGRWDWRHPGRVCGGAGGKAGGSTQERMPPSAESSAAQMAGGSVEGSGEAVHAV